MNIVEEIKNRKLIAIVRGVQSQDMVNTAKALLAGGIRAIEITFNQSADDPIRDTVMAIEAVKKECGDQMLVGAGTVLTKAQAEAAAKAGAVFALAPNVDVDVIREMKRLGLIAVPGGFTASEIMTAYNAGADIVKVFPASSLGVAYIKAIRGPISHVPLMAVGGVDETNTASFLAAGYCSCGIGSNLVRKDLVNEGRFEEITALAKKFVASIG